MLKKAEEFKMMNTNLLMLNSIIEKACYGEDFTLQPYRFENIYKLRIYCYMYIIEKSTKQVLIFTTDKIERIANLCKDEFFKKTGKKVLMISSICDTKDIPKLRI